MPSPYAPNRSDLPGPKNKKWALPGPSWWWLPGSARATTQARRQLGRRPSTDATYPAKPSKLTRPNFSEIYTKANSPGASALPVAFQTHLQTALREKVQGQIADRSNLPGKTFPKSTPNQTHPAPPTFHWPSKAARQPPLAKKSKCKLLTDQTYPAKYFRILLQGKLTRRLRPASGPLRHARQPPLAKKSKAKLLSDQTYPANYFRILLQGQLTRRRCRTTGPPRPPVNHFRRTSPRPICSPTKLTRHALRARDLGQVCPAVEPNLPSTTARPHTGALELIDPV